MERSRERAVEKWERRRAREGWEWDDNALGFLWPCCARLRMMCHLFAVLQGKAIARWMRA